MGNITPKSNKKEQTFGKIIDNIATYYILTADFQSLKKLYDKQYCDNLIILTSDILDRYLSVLEISYLAQRTKNGIEVNEIDKDKVIFLNKENLDKFNIDNSTKKKRVCIGIAKFYIKIAHVFASIVMTINPVYFYKDLDGNIIEKKLFEKSEIPANVITTLKKLGICNNRINALKHGENLDTENVKNIHPNVCSINIGKSGETKSLQDEPGIQELMNLYFDKYDYTSGNFIGMTDETQKDFNSDLQRFYKIFTGNEIMPLTIKKFSDIKLKDYHKLESCQDKNGLLRKNIKLDKNNNKDTLKIKLFEDYAENLKRMIQNTNKKQEELLAIINLLFTSVVDPQTKEKKIIVHPNLTESSLQEIVIKTRKIIINLYLTCENDFVTGIKLYQAIVEKQIKDNTIKQLDVLEKESEKLINL
jgi:hypothetical protein